MVPSHLLDQFDEPVCGELFGISDYLLQPAVWYERRAARLHIISEAVQPVAIIRCKSCVDGSTTNAETIRYCINTDVFVQYQIYRCNARVLTLVFGAF